MELASHMLYVRMKILMHFIQVMCYNIMQLHVTFTTSVAQSTLGCSFRHTVYYLQSLRIQQNIQAEKSKQKVEIVWMWLYWHLIWWCLTILTWVRFYVATVQYHPLDSLIDHLTNLSLSSDHLIYLGLLHWIYCLVFFPELKCQVQCHVCSSFVL